MIKIKRTPSSRICQGDIFSDIEFIERIIERKGKIEVSKIIFPLVVVLTQDCDLESDFLSRWSRKKKPEENNDKFLLSVLVAPIYNAEHVYLGEHLSDLNMKMTPIEKNSSLNKKGIINNTVSRYHYLTFIDEIQISPSIIDFKHYFSVNIEYLKKIKAKNFVCHISELYREQISDRFSHFLSRIGLPN